MREPDLRGAPNRIRISAIDVGELGDRDRGDEEDADFLNEVRFSIQSLGVAGGIVVIPEWRGTHRFTPVIEQHAPMLLTADAQSLDIQIAADRVACCLLQRAPPIIRVLGVGSAMGGAALGDDFARFEIDREHLGRLRA